MKTSMRTRQVSSRMLIATLRFAISTEVLVLLSALFCGCGNSDATVTLDKGQASEMLKLLGTYEGPAHSERIVGALMTGKWTVNFFQDDIGALKCKCILRLHDEQNGWGSPSTTTADVKLLAGSGKGEYSLRTQGQFSDTEPPWTISINGLSLISGHAIETFSLFDNASYEIRLQRQATTSRVSDVAHVSPTAVDPPPIPEVLMTRAQFESAFGPPLLTSEEFDEGFKDLYGFTSAEFLALCKRDRFELLPENKSKVREATTFFGNLSKGLEEDYHFLESTMVIKAVAPGSVADGLQIKVGDILRNLVWTRQSEEYRSIRLPLWLEYFGWTWDERANSRGLAGGTENVSFEVCKPGSKSGVKHEIALDQMLTKYCEEFKIFAGLRDLDSQERGKRMQRFAGHAEMIKEFHNFGLSCAYTHKRIGGLTKTQFLDRVSSQIMVENSTRADISSDMRQAFPNALMAYHGKDLPIQASPHSIVIGFDDIIGSPLPDFDWADIHATLCHLSQERDYDGGVSRLLYFLWFLEQNRAVSDLSFAEYSLPGSMIMVFYQGQRVFLIREYFNYPSLLSKADVLKNYPELLKATANWIPYKQGLSLSIGHLLFARDSVDGPVRRIDMSDIKDLNTILHNEWAAFAIKRFTTIEGHLPLMVRTNERSVSVSSPQHEDPLDLVDFFLAHGSSITDNVSMLGTNYFGQLVRLSKEPDGSRYGLWIGATRVFYPLTVEATKASHGLDNKLAAEHSDLNRIIEDKARQRMIRDALLESVRQRAEEIK